MGTSASLSICKSLSSIQVRHTTSKVSPDLREKSTFGVPLEALVQDATQYGVPFLVIQMVEYLEAFGLERVGIFRISGSVNKIKELKQKYNQGEKVDLVNDGDVDSVASLLKLFLKELPVAVFPDNICSGLLNAFQEHKSHTTECIENLRQLLNCLPKAHQNLLQFLSAFLLKVATHSAVNFMTLENLAVVFGPTLFKIPVSPLTCEEQRLYNGLLLYLLQHHEMLFVDWNSCFSQRQADGLQENNAEDAERDSLMLLSIQDKSFNSTASAEDFLGAAPVPASPLRFLGPEGDAFLCSATFDHYGKSQAGMKVDYIVSALPLGKGQRGADSVVLCPAELREAAAWQSWDWAGHCLKPESPSFKLFLVLFQGL